MNRHSSCLEAAFRPRYLILGTVLLLLLEIPPRLAAGPRAAAEGYDSIPSTALLRPEDVANALQPHANDRPLIFQVGSRLMYVQAHIPGAEYVGAASTSEGIKQLQSRVSNLKRDRFIVIYCGCCPWNRCPNIRPAYKQMRTMGFTHVKVLYIANNFGSDWVDKDYPTEKGK